MNKAGLTWLDNIINVLILSFLGIIIFILYSGGAVLEYALLGFHTKISLKSLANPAVLLIIFTILRFYLWWSQVGTAKYTTGNEETLEGWRRPHGELDKSAVTKVITDSGPLNKVNILMLAIVLLIIFMTCHWLYTIYLTQTSGILMWDEAYHGLWGVKIAEDIEHFDIMSFLSHTNKQTLWPFVHSYLLAISFLLLGDGADTATLLSICASSLVIFFLFLTSLNLSRKDGWFTGILACFLALTSKYYLILSTLIMLEIFGALFTLISLFLYFKAIESGSHKYYFITSIALTVLFLTKYNYGLFLIAILVLTEYISLPNKNYLKKIFASFVKEVLFIKTRNKINVSLKYVLPANTYFLFTPALFLMLIWFIYPYPHKINGFFAFVMKKNYLSQLSVIPFFSLNNFLYYPRIINHDYSISQGVFIITAFFFISSFFKTSNVKIKILRNFFLIGLFLATLHSLKEARFIFTILPAYWLVAAYQANKLITNINLNVLKSNAVFVRIIVIILISFFSYSSVIAYRANFPSELANYYGDKQLTNVLDYISNTVNKKSKVLFLGSFNELSPSLIQWELSKRGGFLSGNIMIDELKRWDRKSYILDPSRMPDKYSSEFNRWMGNPEIDYVVTIEVLDSSKYFSEDYKLFNIWKMNYIYLLENYQNKYSLISERHFSNTGLNIKIYNSIF